VTKPQYKVIPYAMTTSVGTLRRHLYTIHPKEWSAQCKAHGIPITAKSALAAIAAFHGVEPAQDQPRPQFSQERFVDALVEFIVANDLVGLFLSFLKHFFNNHFIAY
jgi:hypothetical protein